MRKGVDDRQEIVQYPNVERTETFNGFIQCDKIHILWNHILYGRGFNFTLELTKHKINLTGRFFELISSGA